MPATPKSKETKTEVRTSVRVLDPHIERLAKHRKISVASTATGTYDFNLPTPRPNTSDEVVGISDFEYIYQTIAPVNKAINLWANRIIGDGFELVPSTQLGADAGTAKSARDSCMQFLESINYTSFFRQSCINALVAGNEWTELIYNGLGSLINVAHGDFNTLDFRRNFINNKIVIGGDGQPTGYWQYIADLSQLYYSLSSYYGEVPAYENLLAAKNRLKESQSLPINATDSEGNVVEVGIMFATTKPNFQFLKKNEIAHLAFQTMNDNFFGISHILPAYNAINHLEQVMYATAEAINTMGYPKPVITVGDPQHPPNKTLNDQAEDAIKDPVRKEGFSLPYFMKLEYLSPNTSNAGQISSYPEWFIKETAMGLRTPAELLTGSGDSNRATSESNSSDFDRDTMSARAKLDQYIYAILNYFLESRGYLESVTGTNLYLPKIRWTSLLTADEALREKMAIERWNSDGITFNEYRRALKMDETKDGRGKLYKSQLNQAAPIAKPEGLPGTTAVNPSEKPEAGGEYGGMLSSQDGKPVEANPMEEGQVITAKHALDPKRKLNPALNRKFKTEDVDYYKLAKATTGKEITDVGSEIVKEIRDAIVNGDARGHKPDTIRRRVMEMAMCSAERADVIIRTERQNLKENGRFLEAKSKSMKTKTWHAHDDAKTCPICKALNGKTVAIDTEFKEKAFKGNGPTAHPNCRCTCTYSNE